MCTEKRGGGLSENIENNILLSAINVLIPTTNISIRGQKLRLHLVRVSFYLGIRNTCFRRFSQHYAVYMLIPKAMASV